MRPCEAPETSMIVVYEVTAMIIFRFKAFWVTTCVTGRRRNKRTFDVNYKSVHVILHKPLNLKVVGCSLAISMPPSRGTHTQGL